MALQAVDDFFNTDEFAETGTYNDGSANTINFIFYEPGTSFQFGATEVVSTEPIADCKISDVSSPKKNDTITRSNGGVYYVAKWQQDGTGMMRLFLSEDQI